MMDGLDKDFIEALLKRNYTMQEISNLLRKRNPNVSGFSLAKTMTFLQEKLLISNSRILQDKQLKRYDIVKNFFGKL